MLHNYPIHRTLGLHLEFVDLLLFLPQNTECCGMLIYIYDKTVTDFFRRWNSIVLLSLLPQNTILALHPLCLDNMRYEIPLFSSYLGTSKQAVFSYRRTVNLISKFKSFIQLKLLHSPALQLEGINLWL